MYEKCKFCTTFWSIPKKHWTNSHRLCPKIGKPVTEEDGCKYFELTNFIRCMKVNQQVPTLACLRRQRSKFVKHCGKCKQGKELYQIWRELNPPRPIQIKEKSHGKSKS